MKNSINYATGALLLMTFAASSALAETTMQGKELNDADKCLRTAYMQQLNEMRETQPFGTIRLEKDVINAFKTQCVAETKQELNALAQLGAVISTIAPPAKDM